MGLGVGIGALASAFFATVFPVAVIGGAYVLARTIYSGTVARRARVLSRVMDELVAAAEDGIRGAPDRSIRPPR